MSEDLDKAQEEALAGRKRSVTSLTLGWLAEKIRRTQDLKERVASGKYQIDSEKVAAAIINED